MTTPSYALSVPPIVNTRLCKLTHEHTLTHCAHEGPNDVLADKPVRCPSSASYNHTFPYDHTQLWHSVDSLTLRSFEQVLVDNTPDKTWLLVGGGWNDGFPHTSAFFERQ